MAVIQASDREDYFRQCGDKAAIIREFDDFIRGHAPHLEPVLFDGMTGTWLSYGLQPYQTKSMKTPSEWPVISLAPQKNYVSLYVMAMDGDEYVAERFASRLGKVSVGKSCIRFKKSEDIDKTVLAELLATVDQSFVAAGK